MTTMIAPAALGKSKEDIAPKLNEKIKKEILTEFEKQKEAGLVRESPILIESDGDLPQASFIGGVIYAFLYDDPFSLQASGYSYATTELQFATAALTDNLIRISDYQSVYSNVSYGYYDNTIDSYTYTAVPNSGNYGLQSSVHVVLTTGSVGNGVAYSNIVYID